MMTIMMMMMTMALEYTEEDLAFFVLWYTKAYARRKKKAPKEEIELHDKLTVDIREMKKENNADTDTDMGDITL